MITLSSFLIFFFLILVLALGLTVSAHSLVSPRASFVSSISSSDCPNSASESHSLTASAPSLQFPSSPYQEKTTNIEFGTKAFTKIIQITHRTDTFSFTGFDFRSQNFSSSFELDCRCKFSVGIAFTSSVSITIAVSFILQKK